jgi:protease-4
VILIGHRGHPEVEGTLGQYQGTAGAIHLVDEMGGLAAAVNYAAQKVKLGEDFRVVEYPRAKPLSEALSEVLEGKHHEQTWAGPVGTLMQKIMAEFQALIRFNDPRGLYARLPVELYLP